MSEMGCSWPSCLAPFDEAGGVLLLDGGTAADWPGRLTLTRNEYRVLRESRITAAGVRALVRVKEVFRDAVVIRRDDPDPSPGYERARDEWRERCR